MSENQSDPAPSITKLPNRAAKTAAELVVGNLSKNPTNGKTGDILTDGGLHDSQHSGGQPKLMITATTSYHSGPLPSVSDFAGYESICEGAARDILDMAKTELRHRAWVEKVSVVGELFLKILLIFVALGIICAMIAGAIYAAMNGHEKLAIVIATGSGLALVAAPLVRVFLGQKDSKPAQSPGKNTPARKKRK